MAHVAPLVRTHSALAATGSGNGSWTRSVLLFRVASLGPTLVKVMKTKLRSPLSRRSPASMLKGIFIPLLAVLSAVLPVAAQTPQATEPPSQVPGVVIDHSPATSGLYIGSPGLAILTNGNYLASHDFFGPKSAEFESARSAIFRSRDRGSSWEKAATIQGAFWSSLFVHRSAVYLLGTDAHHGHIVIRRSADGGISWTEPRDSTSGLLTARAGFHTAPVPVVEHAGRLWRAFEDASGGSKWGERYMAGMMSIPADGDLLVSTNWLFSNFLPSDRSWNGGDMGGWLEGNAVLGVEGNLLNILRVETKTLPELAAIAKVTPDGRRITFDPETGFVRFPGGAKKFTIRFDPVSGRYWSLPTFIAGAASALRPGGIRNTLGLSSSKDLSQWTLHRVLLHHPDIARHGFQYVEWLFDGNDIIAACRTAFDDGQGGAHNNHDANYLTFHRVANFRDLQSTALKMAPDLRTDGPVIPAR